ncbi:MAG: deoxyribose-phosphate aldolase [Anaerolineae bacterium]|nr:deoxyribose-phosphate aldolase [Anaerolineae bacterium]
MTKTELARHLQFTLVSPNATREMIETHLDQCVQYGFDAAMIAMCWVPLARERLQGTGVKVATCISLGLGHETIHAKIGLIRECLALGADEIDYEPNMGFFLSGMDDEFAEEARQVFKAAAGRPVKAMLELGYLKNAEQKRHAAQLLDQAGIPWVKNSSGFGPAAIVATPGDIRLLREAVRPVCKVKASGKVNTYEKAIALLDAGAELIGTSSAPQIIDGIEGSKDGY